MLQKNKVSVIVPIYNVEKYLHQCLDSIIQQTFTNLEIILVNDGTLDQSGVIANEYADKDSRIKLLHKENGGLSDARNHGMKEATGEFTMFVDSDDWLDTLMIEKMLHTCLQHQADIVQSAFYYAYEDKFLIDKKYLEQNKQPTILNKQELMTELVLNKQVKNFAWGKLYKTELIQDIPFKKGVLFEDVFWAHLVMHEVQSYVILIDPFYYYRQRDDSIVATYSLRNLDMIKGLKARHTFIKQHYATLVSESYKNILKMNLIHYYLLHQNREQDTGKTHRNQIQNDIKVNYDDFRRSVADDTQLRRQLLLFSIHPYMNMGYLGVNKLLRKIKVLPKSSQLKQVSV